MLLPPEPKPAPPPFSLEVLARLPLAEAFYGLWNHLTTDDLLRPLYDLHRGASSEDQLTFPQLVRVVADALTRFHGRGRPAILRAIDHQQLSTQQRAVYTKLSRAPLPLAEALLAALTARLRLLLPAGVVHTAWPVSLAGLSIVILDGKKIKRVAKRLLEVRGRPGKVFGGKLLAAYLPALGLAVALAADPDGEANRHPPGPARAAAGPGRRGGAATVGGRPPVLRPGSTGTVLRGGGPLPDPLQQEDGLSPRPVATGSGGRG